MCNGFLNNISRALQSVMTEFSSIDIVVKALNPVDNSEAFAFHIAILGLCW